MSERWTDRQTDGGWIYRMSHLRALTPPCLHCPVVKNIHTCSDFAQTSSSVSLFFSVSYLSDPYEGISCSCNLLSFFYLYAFLLITSSLWSFFLLPLTLYSKLLKEKIEHILSLVKLLWVCKCALKVLFCRADRSIKKSRSQSCKSQSRLKRQRFNSNSNANANASTHVFHFDSFQCISS